MRKHARLYVSRNGGDINRGLLQGNSDRQSALRTGRPGQSGDKPVCGQDEDGIVLRGGADSMRGDGERIDRRLLQAGQMLRQNSSWARWSRGMSAMETARGNNCPGATGNGQESLRRDRTRKSKSSI